MVRGLGGAWRAGGWLVWGYIVGVGGMGLTGWVGELKLELNMKSEGKVKVKVRMQVERKRDNPVHNQT